MSKKSLVTVMLLSCWAFAYAQGVITGLVVGVSDGDTVKVLTPEKTEIRVRLAEIDAPESKQAFGSRSKQSLSDICFGKPATLLVQDIDRYGRTVASVECDGVSAQKHQLNNGMAWVYDRYVKDRTLYVLQHSAQQGLRGLWADNDPVPPWEYRHSQKVTK
ncbi:unnamed protein product [Darwinula stevensoni]|uniref:TNase-like domain-containing protein n=1 Tax=Darwinula stevensoni TaxID=69355 RepID=A0A7R9AH39_9CRUS|nr:unnamed protein product [Darwinula stevensoni]CAG0904758.1 unnamed protein product [Darwinula stevensoni]